MPSVLCKVTNKETKKQRFYCDNVRIAEQDYYFWTMRAWRIDSYQVKESKKFVRFYTRISH